MHRRSPYRVLGAFGLAWLAACNPSYRLGSAPNPLDGSGAGGCQGPTCNQQDGGGSGGASGAAGTGGASGAAGTGGVGGMSGSGGTAGSTGTCGGATCSSSEHCCSVPNGTGICSDQCVAGPCPAVPCKKPDAGSDASGGTQCGSATCTSGQQCCTMPRPSDKVCVPQCVTTTGACPELPCAAPDAGTIACTGSAFACGGNCCGSGQQCCVVAPPDGGSCVAECRSGPCPLTPCASL